VLLRASAASSNIALAYGDAVACSGDNVGDGGGISSVLHHAWLREQTCSWDGMAFDCKIK